MHPEAHGPFLGMVGSAACSDEKQEFTYEVGHVSGSYYAVVADAVDTDDIFVYMYRKGHLVNLSPIHQLNYVGRLPEQSDSNK